MSRRSAERNRALELQVGQAFADKFQAKNIAIQLQDGFADQLYNSVSDLTGSSSYTAVASFTKNGASFTVSCPVHLSGVRSWSGSEKTVLTVKSAACSGNSPELAALTQKPDWSKCLGLELQRDGVTATDVSDPAILYRELQLGLVLKSLFGAEQINVWRDDENYTNVTRSSTSSIGAIEAQIKIKEQTYQLICTIETHNNSSEVSVQDSILLSGCQLSTNEGRSMATSASLGMPPGIHSIRLPAL